jgi:hypothetical protein
MKCILKHDSYADFQCGLGRYFTRGRLRGPVIDPFDRPTRTKTKQIPLISIQSITTADTGANTSGVAEEKAPSLIERQSHTGIH